MTAAFVVGFLISCGPSGSLQQEGFDPAPQYDVSESSALERLSEGIAIPTISYQDSTDFNPEPYEDFISFLKDAYPNIHQSMELERVGKYSLLYKWEGRRDNLKPGMMIGHYDVVPVEEGSEKLWAHPPFSGEQADGFIWGRGTLDDKSGIFSILEAAEYLSSQGFQPERTLYLALHHDEEIGGHQGAKEVSRLLKDRDIELEFLYDEGLPIAEGLIDGIDTPLAMIGVADKGTLSLELSLMREGGHSSMPPNQSVIGELSQAVYRLENNEMPGRFSGLLEETFKPIVPMMSFRERLAFNNLWLFRGSLERKFSKMPPTNAAMRTTTAKTIFNSGMKENVLPINGSVIVNFRIHPDDSVEDVVEHVRRTIDNPDIVIHVRDGARDPSFVSDTDAEPYKLLKRSIRETFSGIPVSPSLFIATSDARHFLDLTDNIYRFRPIRAKDEDRTRVHGTDERIRVDNYLEMIRFNIRFIENINSLSREDEIAGE